MKWRWTIGVVGAATLAVAGLARSAPVARGRTAAPTSQRSFAGARLLALAGGGLLGWEIHGQAQIRAPSGVWIDGIQLPVHGLMSVEPDGGGFLVAGSTTDGDRLAVLMTGAAKEIRRWVLPASAVAVAVDARGRRALTREGTVTLRDDGTLGPPEPYPASGARKWILPPKIIQHDGRTIVCTGANPTMQDFASGTCQFLGQSGWHFDFDSVEPPEACGAWLIVSTGPRASDITLRSMATGAAAGRLSFRTRPALACLEPDRIVLGEKRLSIVRLPSLNTEWSQALPAASTVASVAVTTSVIAYTTDRSPDVWVLPRSAGGP